MKKTLLLVLLVCTPFSYTQAQNSHNNSAETSFKAFLPVWEKAQNLFINGDPTLWKQHTSQRDDVTILGGFGGYGEKGWDAVGTRYDWASSQYKNVGATMKVEYIHTGVSKNMAYTVAIERQTGSRVGEQQDSASRALRVTQIFRREKGVWKLLHRHADPLTENQLSNSPPKE